MRKAKKYYVDIDNMMIHRTNSCVIPRKVLEKSAIPFHAKLRLSGFARMNSGILFYLNDENGNIYVMNHTMMYKCIKNTNISIEGDWGFYQQGTSYSIGLVEEE